MKNTTLCYIKHNNKILMLYRNKKPSDPNEGKWIGIGGKIEENESPEECMLREVREETSLVITDWKYRGIVTFVSDVWEGEYMHLFTANSDTMDIGSCNEDKLSSLNLWEGDRVFLNLIKEDADFFSLKLCYEGDRLVHSVLNGKDIK